MTVEIIQAIGEYILMPLVFAYLAWLIFRGM